MARKSNDEFVEEWKREIEISRYYRQRFKVDWNYWELVYNDLLWGGQEKQSRQRRSTTNNAGHIPQVNELEGIVLNIVPDILFHEPVFEFTPTHPLWDWSAAVWELFASHLYRITGLDETLEQISIDTLITGTGFHKSGYAYEVVSSGYQLGDGSVEGSEIRGDTVFSDFVSPKDVLIDYRARLFRDCRWWAHEVRKPVEEVKENKIYRNTSELVGTESSIDEILGMRSKSDTYKSKRNDTVVLVEIHNMTEGEIITLADGNPKLLRRDPDYGIPLLHQLVFSPSRPQNPYGKSIAQSIEEHVIELSKTIYYMSSHSKRGGLSRWMFDRGKVDRDVVNKMKSSNDFEMIGVDDIASEPIREIKGSSINMDWFQRYQLHEAIIRMLSGVTMQARGRHEPGVETAYEVAKLQEASDRRNRDRIRKLNTYISRVMENLLSIVSDTWPRSKILDAIGIPTELSWQLMPFDRIRVETKYGSTAMDARNEELQKVMVLAQILGQSGLQVSPDGFVRLVSNSLGLSFRQMSLLLQEQPAWGQGGNESGVGLGRGGNTANQVMGQLQMGGS